MPDELNEIIENEWTHIYNVSGLSKAPQKLSLEPNEDERKRLAQRLGIVSVDSLVADLSMTQGTGSMIVHIKGSIKAAIVQSCVVSLEPVPAEIEEIFEAWFADPEAAVSLTKARHERESQSGHSEVKVLDEKDDPEPIIDDKIDLGELVTQHLSLSIEPYPHAEGVEFENKATKDFEDSQSVNNPFAALKDWKSKLTGEE
jgi:uncharacterized metal-binding protein YceD (DUF177 family)